MTHPPRSLLLAIESSCDETAAAVFDSEQSCIGNVVCSQIDIHARYGGVVPELASRNHVMAIADVVRRALDEAGADQEHIGAVAVTAGPGLVGSLLVGLEFAKGFCFAHDLPLIEVNHLDGHIQAPRLRTAQGFDEPVWPALALVVSGGHTSLYRCEAPGDYTEIGWTLDDAAGEAFDKVSKRLGLGYPGGAVIDGLAKKGDPAAIDFPRPMLKKPGHHFSFSGVKTAVAYHLDRVGAVEGEALNDLAASFQEAVAEILAIRTVSAARKHGLGHIIVSGGVACNSRLRALMKERAAHRGITVSVPPPGLCTDNAAMIGVAAWARASAAMRAGGGFAQHRVNARSSWFAGRR